MPKASPLDQLGPVRHMSGVSKDIGSFVSCFDRLLLSMWFRFLGWSSEKKCQNGDPTCADRRFKFLTVFGGTAPIVLGCSDRGFQKITNRTSSKTC